MKRLASKLVIFAYLAALTGGTFAHTVNFKTAFHPMMYFFVWDMFCGWSAYESRTHIIAEGESGRFYRLTPTPWGEYHPYAAAGRQHYDSFGNNAYQIASNCLKQTRHEPMNRIYVVEECWSKKLNLPDAIWESRFDEEKDVHTYFHTRSTWTPDGKLLVFNAPWEIYQANLNLADNPRLQADAQRGRPFYAVNVQKAPGGSELPFLQQKPAQTAPANDIHSLLGN